MNECFECDGHYEQLVIDYESDTPYGKLSVPGVIVLVCNKCEDECIDGENCFKINEAFEKLRKENKYEPVQS
jgi:hypothetical protein